MKYLRKLWYPYAKTFAHRALNNINPLVSYPVSVQYFLEEEKYKDRYINGERMVDIIGEIIREQSGKLSKTIKHIALREKRNNRRSAMSIEKRVKLHSRYRRFCGYYNAKREKAYFDEEFRLAEEAFEKLKKDQSS